MVSVGSSCLWIWRQYSKNLESGEGAERDRAPALREQRWSGGKRGAGFGQSNMKIAFCISEHSWSVVAIASCQERLYQLFLVCSGITCNISLHLSTPVIRTSHHLTGTAVARYLQPVLMMAMPEFGQRAEN